MNKIDTKMKIQYASDLHLEFAENRNFIEDGGIEPVGEVLVLAGDVSYLGDKNMMKRRFYGQTHYAGGLASKIGETTLLCNQLGYVFYGEHRAFDGGAVIEI